MNNRQKISISLVFLLSLFVLYLKFGKIQRKVTTYLPSYIGYNVTNNHFDENGFMAYRISAVKVTSYRQKNQTDFIDPKLILYSVDKKTNKKIQWNITSEKGILYQSNKLILTGKVLIENVTKNEVIQTMKTEQLTALLDKKQVMTDLPVQWTGPQMEESGIGMWASFITEELIVKNKINAVYFNEKK